MTDKQKPVVTLPAELVLGVLAYLRGRPYAEVAQGVIALETALEGQLKPAAVTDA